VQIGRKSDFHGWGNRYTESAAGVRAEVMDGGIRAKHQDFQANPPIFHPSNSTDNSHGTSVYGIVFGIGAGNATARGLLPNADQPVTGLFSKPIAGETHEPQLIQLFQPKWMITYSTTTSSSSNPRAAQRRNPAPRMEPILRPGCHIARLKSRTYLLFFAPG